MGSGEVLVEEWVSPEEVVWKSGTPTAADFGIELEEVVEKMSKSRGNVVNPDDVVAQHGADAMRLYEMFIGPLSKAAPWSTEGLPGVVRFLHRSYRLLMDEADGSDVLRELPAAPASEAQERLLARTVHRVTDQLDALEFNTAIADLMTFVRDAEKDGPVWRRGAETFVKLLAPFAPHLAEELWSQLGHPASLAYELWPTADACLLVEEEVEIAVQVSGKLRARIRVPAEADQATVRERALSDPNVARHLGDREPVRVIYVPRRLINLVA
jgi:leucyl-tRNA synthetase